MSKKLQHIRINSHWQLIKPIYQQKNIFHQEKRNTSLLSVLIIKEFMYITLEEETKI